MIGTGACAEEVMGKVIFLGGDEGNCRDGCEEMFAIRCAEQGSSGATELRDCGSQSRFAVASLFEDPALISSE